MKPRFFDGSFCNRNGCVWILVLFTLFLSGCKKELFGKLDEADANAVLSALYSEGISAERVLVGDSSWRIDVDEKDHQKALLVTRNQGVPKERFASMGELFKKEGLVSTPSEIRMRYIFALSQELSNTLSNIDGVISARVHPVIPVNDPLSEKTEPASAAVFIKHLPDADLQQMAPAIKTLVTKSIEGLKVENVSLTFFSSKAPMQVLPAPPPTGLLNETVVSSVALALASLLALTWGVLGWKMWRKQRKPLTSSRTTALSPVAPHPAPLPSGDNNMWRRWGDIEGRDPQSSRRVSGRGDRNGRTESDSFDSTFTEAASKVENDYER